MRSVQPGARANFWNGPSQVGLKEVGPLLGRGSAAADFDNDGDLDVAINVIAGRLVLLENSGATGHWLRIAPGRVIPGLRAEVHLPDGTVLHAEVHAGSSYLSGDDHRLLFGVGPYTSLPLVKVMHPDGAVQEWRDVAADRVINSQ